MILKNMHKLLAAASLLVALGLFSSCKKSFDLHPEQSLAREEMYRNVYDADAAIIGLYGKFSGLARQYVVLNELRADLMQVTPNADDALKQLSGHRVTENNPYANPRPYYELIVNCNDVMKNFSLMLEEKKFTRDEFNQRYADVVALRSWIYLQLGIHFGEVPYVTDALENVEAVKDASKFPRLTLDQLVDRLIGVTDSLNFKNLYPTTTSLVTTVDGYNTAKFYINKKCLLGDLYLWRSAFTGSTADARLAAAYYKDVLETGGADYDMYRVRAGDVLNNSDISINYWGDARTRKYDETALVDDNNYGWRSIFARGQDNLYNQEWIWMLYFDKNFAPQNPFIDLFSNRGGRYQVKPSQQAIDNWNSQVQLDNNFPYDARGRLTYKMLDGQPVIMKYLYNYLHNTTYQPVNLLEKPGKFFLYRVALLHLRYAEAANRDGENKIAYALVNNGIKVNFDNNSGNADVTHNQQTFKPYPYNFDARKGDYPYYAAPWHRNVGLRGRANLKPLAIPAGTDSTLAIENMILDEGALELAYEGARWADLLRIAIRRQDPNVIADRIAAKLTKDNVPGLSAANAAKLRSGESWGNKMLNKNLYLPFRWK